jgi:HD-like signal output (HDOD) protein
VHSREIAKYSKLLAEEMPGINPGEAYLAGLLHAIDLLPEVLGWDSGTSGPADRAHVAMTMARKWALPSCVMELFHEDRRANGAAAPWSGIVRAAHRRANKSSIPCSFEEVMRPQLHIARQPM